MIRVMDLFSGIGGFSLGLRRAGGFRTVCFCEVDDYCQRVLLSRMRDGHLDTAPICTDIRCLDGKPWAGRVELICGGFPCQDISVAGQRAGIDGARSGLWSEMGRLVREVRPRYVFVENVSALLGRGLERVLGDLASSGYDAEWDCIPASAIGANHRRDRIWLVAYPMPSGKRRKPRKAKAERDADNAVRGRHGLPQGQVFAGGNGPEHSGWWDVEPGMGRVADGIPGRVDRLTGLGNAIVPQIAEWIGRRIMKAESGGV